MKLGKGIVNYVIFYVKWRQEMGERNLESINILKYKWHGVASKFGGSVEVIELVKSYYHYWQPNK